MQHDLVIRGGTVVDGSGLGSFGADVAVDDGLIVEVGRVSGRGTQELNATGAVVAPGFIDGHTHFDAQVFWRSEEHTSELQSLMRISYAVFCLKKNTTTTTLDISL